MLCADASDTFESLMYGNKGRLSDARVCLCSQGWLLGVWLGSLKDKSQQISEVAQLLTDGVIVPESGDLLPSVTCIRSLPCLQEWTQAITAERHAQWCLNVHEVCAVHQPCLCPLLLLHACLR